MSNRKRDAKSIGIKASELLEKYDLLNAPIDVYALAERLGADVTEEDLEDDVSGFLLREQGVCKIALNKHHHRNRQRFSLAHECGHLFLHAQQGDRLWLDKTLYFRDGRSSDGDQVAEIEANQFAAGILMPEKLIREAIGNQSEISEFDVHRLALRFEVSERAMTVRLISLGLIQPVVA